YHHPGQPDVDPNAKNPDGTPVNPYRKPYDEYRKAFMSDQLRTLFDHHKKSTWFIERYHLGEQYVALRTRTRKIGWTGRIDDFIGKVEQGQFDPPKLELDATPPPLSAPVQQTKEATTSEAGGGADPANGHGSMTEEKGNGTAAGDMDMDEPRPDDEMDINMFDGEGGNEINGVGDADAATAKVGRDALPADPQVTAEEVSVEPEGVQIMIRTIPPDLGRIKIEEACQKIPGFMYLALGDPMQKRNYYRCGWIRFEEDVDVPEVIAKLGEEKLDGFRMQLTHSTRPFVAKMRMAPGAGSRPERIVVDLGKIRKLASLLEEQAEHLATLPAEDQSITSPTDPRDRGTVAVEARAKHLAEMLDAQFPDGEEEKMVAKKNAMTFDLYLAYIRHAFNCCYYCAAVTDFHEELLRKCIQHGRSPPTNKSDWKETRWLEWLDSKIALLIDKENVDPTAYGGKDIAKETKRLCEPHIKREDEGKFRCIDCTKLFKAEAFVEKHITNKHSEVTQSLDDLPFFNNFALDPHRIQPFSHAPPTTGAQQPPPQAYGLRPREPPSGRDHADPYRYAHPAGHHHQPPPISWSGGGSYGEYPPPRDADGYYRRRDRSPPSNRRRLSDRLGDRVYDPPPLVLTGSEGLPAKPSTTFAEPMAGSAATPPPGKAKEDPRASAGRKVSYLDMDEVAEGDIELSY
ncbi:hypothetical protein FRB90_007135, partial [Tulasnella sp. 427]